MPFPDRLKRQIVNGADSCEVCGDPLHPNAAEAHSVTGLHCEHLGNGKMIVHDPPQAHQILKGKSISEKISPFLARGTDGMAVCPCCHNEIHESALVEAQLSVPDFKGNLPPPEILVEVSLAYLERNRPTDYFVL